MSLLLLGPKFSKKGELGGVVVSFDLLLSTLKNREIDYKLIDTNLANYSNKALALIIIYVKILILIPRSNSISLHGTANDFRYIAPFTVLLSNLFNKKVSLRKFAGSFIEEYKKSNKLSKYLIRYSLRNANQIFFQTKYLINYFLKYNNNTYWFPTVRNKPKMARDSRKLFKKRFIFLGQIRKEKGVEEIIEVSKLLGNDFTIDLYGSLMDKSFLRINSNQYPNLSYKGELSPKEVSNVLMKYDVLLLPTYWQGEGYPGVIIEALSVGLPIIATNLPGISEMIDERSSILIDPKSIDQLRNAIESFDQANYLNKSSAAFSQFENFDSDNQTEVFLNTLEIKC